MRKSKNRGARLSSKLTALLLTLATVVSLVTPAAAAETATAAAIRLSKTEGTVTISKSSGRSVSLRNNMRLYSGYHVVTSEKSYAWIDLDDVKLIKEDASSETEVRKSGKKLEVNVVSGQVFFNVAESLKDDETLNISTSTMVVGIRGTTGWVRVVDRWKTEVCLLEGTVQCVVTDPVTGQLKTAVLRGGDVAECIVYPQDKAGDKCDITLKKQTVDGIPGYALTDLVRDVPLCDKILEDSGLDILGDLAKTAGGPEDGRAPGGSAASQEVIREAEKRQEQEEERTGQKLEDIRKEVSEQDNNVSKTGVWDKVNTAAPSSGSGGGSGSTPTPAASNTMKLTDIQVQALLNGAGNITVRANTDTSDTTPNKNLLEIDNGLSVAAGKTLTLNSGIDVAVRPGKTLQVDGTMHTSGSLDNNGTVNVTSGDTLRVKNLTIESSGTLNVSATGRVVADGTFNILTGGVLEPQASTAVVMAKEFSGSGGVIALPYGWRVSDTADSEGYYHLLPSTSYLISLDPNGGTLGAEAGGNTPVGMDTNPDGTINLSSIPNPTHSSANHSFAGWYTAPTGGTQITADTVFTTDATIYAHWDIALYSIDFDLNGGNIGGDTTNPGVVTNEAGKIFGALPAPTRDNYVFLGWYTTQDSGGVRVTADTVFTADTTIYARWGTSIPAPITITFEDPSGGTGTTTLSINPGDAAQLPDRTRSADNGGYTFLGWYTAADGGTLVGAAGETYTFSTDTTLYARWSGWGYDTATKTLTIEGTGSMDDYNVSSDAPWNSLRSDIESVIIQDGITTVGKNAFYQHTNLKSVSIPNTVTSIGEFAFSNSTSLTSVNIPSTVTSIGGSAFENCKALTSVTIPSSVSTMGASVFRNCDNLTTADIGANTGEMTFNGCDNLANVTIQDTVTTIGTNTFADCAKLTSITIPTSVTVINTSAFARTGLTSVVIPSSVTSISDQTFINCTALTSVTIPDSVTSIGGEAFSGCSSLANITVPNSVTSIGVSAFASSGLTSITIPAIENIENRMFRDCKALASVTIPDSVKSIGTGAFSGCSALVSITIPNQVHSIWQEAFNGCTSLTSITIPASVRSIENQAFQYCTNLHTVTFAENSELTRIASHAFLYCIKLTEFEIPDKVSSIQSSTFSDCSSLAKITIPVSVTTIQISAFSGCTNLTDISYAGTAEQWDAITKNSTTGLEGKTITCTDGSVTVPASE